MQRYLAFAVIALGGTALAVWVVAQVLSWIGNGLTSASNSITAWRRRRAALANQKKLEHERLKEEKRLEDKRQREEAARLAEQEQIAQFRGEHPAQIVGVPNLATVSTGVTVLKDFVAKADAYRPKFNSSYDTKFRTVYFSFPFEFFFPRDCEGSSNGPAPEPWTITLDSLVGPRGRDLGSVYKSVISMQSFPCVAPTIVFDPVTPPKYPEVSRPRWDIKIVTADTGGEVDFRVEMLRKIYATEIAQAEKLRQMASDIEELRKRAEEAKDLMDIHIAKERLAYQEAQNSLTAQYNGCRQNWEQQCNMISN
jgi:hypothetical protein